MYSHIAEARRDGERKIEWWGGGFRIMLCNPHGY